MDLANQAAITNIQQKHLTGKGPFPVAEHKLGTVTNLLRGSVWASGTQQIGDGQVQSAIGSNVKYAAIHEFGGRTHHEPRQKKIRHRVDARGTLLTQVVTRKNGKSFIGLIFARNSHKRVREQMVDVKGYDTNMPERMPFRTGLDESRPGYNTLISRAIRQEWDQMKA